MKSTMKNAIAALCRLVVLPMVLVYRIQVMFSRDERVFSGWSQLWSLLPGMSGVYLRRAFFQSTMKHCSGDVWISFGTLFSHPGASIGRSAYIGNYCSIGDVQVGDDVLIASHVSIMNGCRQHGIESLDIPIREQPGVYEPVSIGTGAWIGERATVAADIGKHCVVGAGALVLKPLPDYCIAVGVPARIVGDRRNQIHRPEEDQPECFNELSEGDSEPSSGHHQKEHDDSSVAVSGETLSTSCS